MDYHALWELKRAVAAAKIRLSLGLSATVTVLPSSSERVCTTALTPFELEVASKPLLEVSAGILETIIGRSTQDPQWSNFKVRDELMSQA